MQNHALLSSDTFFNFIHWLSFIANKKQVWISKAYNSKTTILNPDALKSNSIFYPLSPVLEENEEIIQTCGGLFNFFYLTNHGRIFQIGNNHQHKNNEFLPVALPQELGENEKITQMIIKETASMLISNHQNIYVSGQNRFGELGLAPSNYISHFSKVPLKLEANETIIKFVTSNKDSLFHHDAIKNYHSAFFTSGNRLFVCGSNFLNELGLEERLPGTEFRQSPLNLENDGICDIAVSSRATFVLTTAGKLWVSGSYVYGCDNQHLYTNHTFKQFQIPKLNLEEKLVQLSVGLEHCILLTNKGRLLVSGKNSCGELGLGHTQGQIGFTFAHPKLLKNEKITQVSCINQQSILQTSADRILFSGQFIDFTNPTRHKQNTSFKTLFYPKELYQAQLSLSRVLICLSIASYTGAIFTSHVLHVTFLIAGTSFLLPAIYLYLLSKHNEILFKCEQNQINEINQALSINL